MEFCRSMLEKRESEREKENERERARERERKRERKRHKQWEGRGKESGMVVDKDTDIQRFMKTQICGTGKILQRLYHTAKRRI